MATPFCLPAWHHIGLIKGTLASGCPTVNGNVNCDPEDMRRNAEAKLKALGYLPANGSLSLEAYTLARYMTSEFGGGTPEERVAVGEAAVNRARLEGLVSGVVGLLLYRQAPGNPHRGYYGPIHGPQGVTTAPYGRWAATSRDPNIADVLLAQLILSGQTNNFNNGADDQAGFEYAAAFPNPQATVRRFASQGNYWVGPLPNVNHWKTSQFRHYGVSPSSVDGAALLQRGLDAFAVRGAATNWSGLRACPTDGGSGDGVQVVPSVAAGGGKLRGAVLAFVGIVGIGLIGLSIFDRGAE